MLKLSLHEYNDGEYRLVFFNSEHKEYGFYMNFNFTDPKETAPAVFLIKMADMIKCLFADLGKEFTWELKSKV